MEKLNSFLKTLTYKELEVLQKLLNTKNNNADEITAAYSKLPFNLFTRYSSKLSYEDVLHKIATSNQISILETSSIAAKEKDLFQKLFVKEFDSMTESQKEVFFLQLQHEGLTKAQITSLTSLAAITAAQASGFGVYLLASFTVGAISGALGLAVPFAFYTGMSSAISIIIGPIGFLVLGYSLYKSFKDVKSIEEMKTIMSQTSNQIVNWFSGDMKKTEVIFKYIASIRLVKIQQTEEHIKQTMEGIKEMELEKNKFMEEQNKYQIESNELELKMKEIVIQMEELNKQKEQHQASRNELHSLMDNMTSKMSNLNQKLIEKNMVVSAKTMLLNQLKN